MVTWGLAFTPSVNAQTYGHFTPHPHLPEITILNSLDKQQELAQIYTAQFTNAQSHCFQISHIMYKLAWLIAELAITKLSPCKKCRHTILNAQIHPYIQISIHSLVVRHDHKGVQSTPVALVFFENMSK